MVIQYGKSGAEKSVIILAKRAGFSIENLNEIDLLLDETKEQYREGKSITYDQITLEIDDLKRNIDTSEKTLEVQKSQIVEDIESEKEILREEIEDLQVIKFEIRHLLKYIFSTLKLRRSMKRLNHLETEPDIEINKRQKYSLSSLESLKRQLNYLENNTEKEVESRLSNIVMQMNKLEGIANSNEYKGAVGELAVIQNLCELSDDYCLLNDVYIELRDYIKFDGSYLKSAQIDHLVVGPTGLYVIETKNWSGSYTESVFNDGTYTPYDQIKRGNYLVYRYLKNNNLAHSVESIIVVTGSRIPPCDNNRHTKVLSHNYIARYICNRDPILTDAAVNKLANKFRYKV
ncbi:MAG: hypothetical protein EOM59_17555 [Clostridia bacterium]|uniref:NERD domain-containing protein n=1 Tax=Methanocorpusculum parvum TaxID=2193 RepID=A0AAX0Q9L4_9EURY|nr:MULTISPECIES: nuclease-related domain-containing protein [Methanocorpusculum]MDY3203206.1 NERD domain-containing protein [Methanocorpusculum sp.]MEA5086820.1 NERD domain-containing protein [Methanocorpusculum sp.]NCB44402.1 hypothetical protein [Clostridia bacterium]PAV10144.1 hypothetical protein ASJ83_06730 [Methanocorpusculum parvum]